MKSLNFTAMNKFVSRVVAGCVVGVTLGLMIMSAQATQVVKTIDPAMMSANPATFNNTNRFFQGPGRVNWITVANNNATTNSAALLFYDAHTNAYTNQMVYVVPGSSNTVNNYYMTNYIYSWTNNWGITFTNYYSAQVYYSTTNTVATTTPSWNLMATLVAPANSSISWTNSTGVINVFGLVLNTTNPLANCTITVDYSPIH